MKSDFALYPVPSMDMMFRQPDTSVSGGENHTSALFSEAESLCSTHSDRDGANENSNPFSFLSFSRFSSLVPTYRLACKGWAANYHSAIAATKRPRGYGQVRDAIVRPNGVPCNFLPANIASHRSGRNQAVAVATSAIFAAFRAVGGAGDRAFLTQNAIGGTDGTDANSAIKPGILPVAIRSEGADTSANGRLTPVSTLTLWHRIAIAAIAANTSICMAIRLTGRDDFSDISSSLAIS